MIHETIQQEADIIVIPQNPFNLLSDIELIKQMEQLALIESYTGIPLKGATKVGWSLEKSQIIQYECVLTELGKSAMNESPLRDALRRGIKLRAAKT